MVWIVIPAFNEEKNIDRVISDLFKHGYENILVVDDGSKDNTLQKAVVAGAKTIKHTINRGQGAALETGNQFVKNKNVEIVVHFDADGQFNPADIKEAIRLVKDENYDAVIGSRFLDKRSKIPFFKKYFILPVARFINYLATGLKLSDAHNGFRVFNKKSLDKIHFTQDGMAHNSEFIYQIKKYNFKYIEMPVEVFYHEYGQGFLGGIKIIQDLLISKLIK